MDKEMWYMHTMECFSATRKKEILLFAISWMDPVGGGIMLCEISHTKKDKYFMVSFICGVFKKKVKIIETHSRKVVVRGKLGELGKRVQNFQLYDA